MEAQQQMDGGEEGRMDGGEEVRERRPRGQVEEEETDDWRRSNPCCTL